MFAHIEQSRFSLNSITAYGVDDFTLTIFCANECFEKVYDTESAARAALNHLDELFTDFCIAPKFVKIGEVRIDVDDILKYYLDGDSILIVELRSQPNNSMRLPFNDPENAKRIIYDLDISFNTACAMLDHLDH
ncbi:hypothetical protein ACYUFO_002226 [Vibrio parahaemolyticus]